MIEVLIPTFGRADRLSSVWDNVRWGSHTDPKITFIAEYEDCASIEVLKGSGLPYILNTGPRNYAGAINTAYRQSEADFLFCGSDDLNFHDSWDLELLKHVDDWFEVYGTNDLFNPYVLSGVHATHYLVRREYLNKTGGMIDVGAGSFLNDAYDHNFTDTEFVWTAKARARFKPVLTSVVEHNHWGARKAQKDPTYLKGLAKYHQDRELYMSRRHLWMDIAK